VSEGPVVIVKFRRAAEASGRCARLARLLGEDLLGAEPLFPDERDPELASLFQLTLRGQTSVARVIGSLAADREVEYAHEPAQREPA
jgi:hypothetical protein